MSGTRDKLEGNLDEAKGRVKEGFGGLTGDESTQAEGQMDQAKGEGKQALGGVKGAAEDAKDAVKDAFGKKNS